MRKIWELEEVQWRLYELIRHIRLSGVRELTGMKFWLVVKQKKSPIFRYIVQTIKGERALPFCQKIKLQSKVWDWKLFFWQKRISWPITKVTILRLSANQTFWAVTPWSVLYCRGSFKWKPVFSNYWNLEFFHRFKDIWWK